MSWHKLVDAYQGCRYASARHQGRQSWELLLAVLQCECIVCRRAVEMAARQERPVEPGVLERWELCRNRPSERR